MFCNKKYNGVYSPLCIFMKIMGLAQALPNQKKKVWLDLIIRINHIEESQLKMVDEVLVDALPYIDQEYDDPNFREAVSL